MGFLLVYENRNIRFYYMKEFREEGTYSVGRIDEEKKIYPDISFDPESQSISRKQGSISVLYGQLYYTEKHNNNPTHLNNYILNDETFQMANDGSAYNVFSFMHSDGYPIAFMFLVDNEEWNYEELEGDDIKIGGSNEADVYIEELPEELMELDNVDGHYFIHVKEEELEKFWYIDDNNDFIELHRNMRLEWDKTYRFLYNDEYLFIVGGRTILYGKV